MCIMREMLVDARVYSVLLRFVGGDESELLRRKVKDITELSVVYLSFY